MIWILLLLFFFGLGSPSHGSWEPFDYWTFTWFGRSFSFIRINNLTDSMLWHKVLDPPKEPLKVQNAFCWFFLEWPLAFSWGVLSSRCRGRSRPFTCWIKNCSNETTQTVTTAALLWWYAVYILKDLGGTDLDKELFVNEKPYVENMYNFSLFKFYVSIFQSWSLFNFLRVGDENYGCALFFNPLLS